MAHSRGWEAMRPGGWEAESEKY